jgi:PBSX family phage terminase large subunit
MSSFPLSQKYIDFINTTDVRAEFLEGTTMSGKTTIGAGVKFMRMVSASKRKLHLIAALDTGTAEKNILQQDNGLLDLHRNARYFGNGDANYKLPHIKFEDKIILVFGYGDRTKWKKVLGGQYGCIFIDEVNTADIEFVRELSTRNDYLLATLNPDDPDMPIYREFINHARPFRKYAQDVPQDILAALTEEEKPGWRYWFFSFRDNLSLTEEDISRRIANAPAGTKFYKNKILGLRGRATGLVFQGFDRARHTFREGKLQLQIERGELRFVRFTAGLDTSYSTQSEDTIAMIFQGIDNRRRLLTLEEIVIQNANEMTPLAPSDIAARFVAFLEDCRHKWGFARDVYIDSADQATITELHKLKRAKGCLYSFRNSYKKLPILDRIHLQSGWIATGHYLVNETCREHLHELAVYSWDDSGTMPEDRHDHTINANQYAWIPYKNLIGGEQL